MDKIALAKSDGFMHERNGDIDWVHLHLSPCQIVCRKCWYWGCLFGTAVFFNPTYKKLFAPPPILHSHPYHFHWVSDVWWSNPDIFYILMQNKQITQVPPPSWFVEVANQIKLPFLFLSFHLTCALSGCVLARPFNWNSVKHRASFVVRLFFLFFFPYKVFAKENRIFLSWAQVPPSTLMLPVWHSLSTSALVNTPVLHTLFITLKGETLLILF